MAMTTERAEGLLTAIVGRRIVVLGDVMVDAYVIGELNRISPEAPVPVLQVTEDRFTLGGAANAAKQARALGVEVMLVGLVGEDRDAETLRELAERWGIDASCLVSHATRCTTRKTRIVARHQQVIRVDREDPGEVDEATEGRLIEAVERAMEGADGLLIADYGKGVVTDRVAAAAVGAAKRRGVASLVDPKNPPWEKFAGCTVLKPNRVESEAVLGRNVVDDATAAGAAGELAERYEAEAVLLTRGPHGMTLHAAADRSEAAGGTAHVPARLTGDLADVTGCGDVVAATMLAAMCAGGGAGGGALRNRNQPNAPCRSDLQIAIPP